jgi:hypothetical protein
MTGKVNNELEQIWNEAAMVKYRVQLQTAAGANEEKRTRNFSQEGQH